MPHLGIRYIDFGIYGDGDIYESDANVSLAYSVEREVHGHRISVRLRYTASLIPGGSEAFRLHDLRLRLAPDSQFSFTHEAFIDRVTPSNRLSVRVTHTGSEFNINHIQLIAQRKKHQPIG